MYVRTICPCCGEFIFQNVIIHSLETTTFFGDRKSACTYVIENAFASETVQERALVHDIATVLNSLGEKDIDDEELKKLLMQGFGVVSSSCDDLVPLVKAELKSKREKNN